ncbi:MAG: hypothetical protein ACE5FH_13410 [Candidatus Zixiibacteriota bacterium]
MNSWLHRPAHIADTLNMDRGKLSKTAHIEKFKRCPCCKVWMSSIEIMEDPSIEIEGMGMGDNGSVNLFFFTHRRQNCNTTFAIPAESLEPFIDEEIPPEILMGTSDCEHRCMHICDLQVCSQPCRYATFRRFLVKILARKREQMSNSV